MRLFRRAGLVIDWNSQMVEVAGNAVVCALLFCLQFIQMPVVTALL